MANPVSGDVIVTPFPFSDLSQSKRRPALVIANLTGDDIILCQITTQVHHDNYSVELGKADFVSGGLDRPSNVRPNRLFTADSQNVLYTAGSISKEKLSEIIDAVVTILRGT